MSKRLQVIFSESEIRDLQLLARGRGLTVAAWVRLALREAARQEPRGDFRKKLAIVRHAARHAFPSSDLATVLVPRAATPPAASRSVDPGKVTP